jgi:hypothetical protein
MAYKTLKELAAEHAVAKINGETPEQVLAASNQAARVWNAIDGELYPAAKERALAIYMVLRREYTALLIKHLENIGGDK